MATIKKGSAEVRKLKSQGNKIATEMNKYTDQIINAKTPAAKKAARARLDRATAKMSKVQHELWKRGTSIDR